MPDGHMMESYLAGLSSEEEGVVTSLPLGPHRLEETEPVDQHSREHPQSGGSIRGIPDACRHLRQLVQYRSHSGASLRCSREAKRSRPHQVISGGSSLYVMTSYSGSTVVEVSIGESPDSHTHPSDSSSLAEEHNTTTARKHHRHSDAEAGSKNGVYGVDGYDLSFQSEDTFLCVKLHNAPHLPCTLLTMTSRCCLRCTVG